MLITHIAGGACAEAAEGGTKVSNGVVAASYRLLAEIEPLYTDMPASLYRRRQIPNPHSLTLFAMAS